MKGFVITGTSGVGKTHLEIELAKLINFYQLPKYTNRPGRPGESSATVISMSAQEFKKIDRGKGFVFTLEYGGFDYGWKQSEASANSDKYLTLGVTLESLKRIFEFLPKFKPILLTVDKKNIELIRKRMYKREDFTKLYGDDKEKLEQKIESRLNLALKELENIKEYEKIVLSHSGKVFLIKDNRTLYKEVIPWVLTQTDSDQ